MSELFLVRHAQASYGTDDYDRLSRLGHQQARWLGEYFLQRELSFDHVICGDMRRHRETLEGISTGMGQASPAHTLAPGWNEFDFESLIKAYLQDNPQQRPPADSAKTELLAVLSKTLEAWADKRLAETIPESFDQFEQRVSTALSMATAQAKPGSRILVVSSGGAISMALRQVLMTPASAMFRMNIQTKNSSFSHLYFNEKDLELAGFNHTPHLDQPDRHSAVTYF